MSKDHPNMKQEPFLCSASPHLRLYFTAATSSSVASMMVAGSKVCLALTTAAAATFGLSIAFPVLPRLLYSRPVDALLQKHPDAHDGFVNQGDVDDFGAIPILHHLLDLDEYNDYVANVQGIQEPATAVPDVRNKVKMPPQPRMVVAKVRVEEGGTAVRLDSRTVSTGSDTRVVDTRASHGFDPSLLFFNDVHRPHHAQPQSASDDQAQKKKLKSVIDDNDAGASTSKQAQEDGEEARVQKRDVTTEYNVSAHANLTENYKQDGKEHRAGTDSSNQVASRLFTKTHTNATDVVASDSKEHHAEPNSKVEKLDETFPVPATESPLSTEYDHMFPSYSDE